MSEITAGHVWSDNDLLDAAGLNAAFSAATIQAAFITGKSVIVPLAGDYFLFYDVSGALLGKCTIGDAILTKVGTSAGTIAAGNDSRFSASVNGIRKAAGLGGTDTLAVPKDFVLSPTAASLTAGVVSLDCNTNNLFTVTLNANATIELKNISDGDKIRVQITQDGSGSRTLAWTTTQTKIYVGGAAPTPTATADSIDLWCFERIGNKLFTYAWQALA